MGQLHPQVSGAARRSGGWLVLAPGVALPGGDHRIHAVTSGASFRAVLRAERPRLAVLSIPPGGELDLRELMNERERRPGLTAVLLTEAGAVADRVAALEAGLDEALSRETDPRELLARLQRLDRGRAVELDSDRLPVADGIQLAISSRDLVRAGERVHLRPKEFGLLFLLARHPGRTFTREQVLDLAWGPSTDATPRTVDVHVRWLREKLEPRPGEPRYLLTVRGVGYRLEPAADHSPVALTEA